MSMIETIERLWRLPRDLVSDGFDAALADLAGQAPMTVHEYASGTECFTWIVPEKWTCLEARLETLDGRTLFSYEDNPLHVVSYSLPFEGEVDRETLLAHLHSHPRLPEAVPFVFKYYRRDWGLCCSGNQRRELTDPAYRVVLRTRFEPGRLKVGEILVPGEREDGYVFCAHLCHPGMVNDDLAGVAVGLDVFRRLLDGPRPRYTYRLLILPETIGSAAWLAHNMDLVPNLRGGLFLEMLGTPHPHSFQRSNTPDSQLDRVCETVLRDLDPRAWSAGFLRVILNDERMFNGPGIRVPMASLSRVLPPEHPEHPYREYHTSLDNPGALDAANLERSRDLVLAIVEALEANAVPRPLFQGELFCSRYPGIDYERMFRAIQAVTYRLDGRRSLADMAWESGLGFREIREFVEALTAEGLVELRSV